LVSLFLNPEYIVLNTPSTTILNKKAPTVSGRGKVGVEA
jgi:hypothetical protein